MDTAVATGHPRAVARTTAPLKPGSTPPARRRRRWVLAILPWALAAVLGGATAWAIPAAGRSNDLRTRAAALSGKVAGAEDRSVALQARLEDLRSGLTEAREQGNHLASTEARNAKRIKHLEARVEELEAAAAAAAAAAATSASSSSSSSGSTYPAIEPAQLETGCFIRYNPTTGEREELC